MSAKFIYRILVPKTYEISVERKEYRILPEHSKIFDFSADEYELLKKPGGLYELYYAAFNTIIVKGEEDRMRAQNVPLALDITEKFIATIDNESERLAALKVREALSFALKNKAFVEFANSVAV